MRVNKKLVDSLNKVVGEQLAVHLDKRFREKYGADFNVSTNGTGVSFRMFNQNFNIYFSLEESKVHVKVEGDINRDRLEEILEQSLREKISDNKLDRESRYLSRRYVEQSGEYTGVGCRLKRMPESGDEAVLECEIYSFIALPLLKAIHEIK